MRGTLVASFAALAGLGLSMSASAVPLSVRDSFRIGSGGTIFCSAQSVITDKALTGMFDAGYSLTCRDAASPIGKMYKLRDTATAPARIAAARGDGIICDASAPGRIDRARPGRDHRMQAQGPRRRLSRLSVSQGQGLLLGRGPCRLRQRGPARPAQPGRGRSRSRAKCRSPPPASATRRHLPGCRPGRWTRARRWPRPIAATMPEAMPKPRNSSQR